MDHSFSTTSENKNIFSNNIFCKHAKNNSQKDIISVNFILYQIEAFGYLPLFQSGSRQGKIGIKIENTDIL